MNNTFMFKIDQNLDYLILYFIMKIIFNDLIDTLMVLQIFITKKST